MLTFTQAKLTLVAMRSSRVASCPDFGGRVMYLADTKHATPTPPTPVWDKRKVPKKLSHCEKKHTRNGNKQPGATVYLLVKPTASRREKRLCCRNSELWTRCPSARPAKCGGCASRGALACGTCTYKGPHVVTPNTTTSATSSASKPAHTLAAAAAEYTCVSRVVCTQTFPAPFA